jgi:hypothetical protein
MESKEIWKKLMERSNAANLNCFAYVNKNGEVSYHDSRICFSSWYGESSKMIFDLSKRICEDKSCEFIGVKDRANGVRYLDYLLNRSPFRETFLVKDAEEVASSFVEPDLSRSCSEVCAGLTAIRCSYEFGFADLFCEFIDKNKGKINEDQALLLCCMFNNSGFSSRRSFGTGHSLLPFKPSLKAYTNTIKGIVNEGSIQEPKKKTSSFNGVHLFYGHSSGYKGDLEKLTVSMKTEAVNNGHDKAIEIFLKEWENAIQG